VAVSHQTPSFLVIDLTTAKLPRRPCAEPLCNVSITLASTRAACGFGVVAGESRSFPIQIAICASQAATQPKPAQPARPQQPARPGPVVADFPHLAVTPRPRPAASTHSPAAHGIYAR
jgi:hypothetical protein